MAIRRIATAIGALAVVASLLAACNLVAGTTPQPTLCNGVPADIGGCDNPPVYQGTTCEALSAEWGQEVNDRILRVIAEPAVVGNEQRSVRVHSVLVLATVTLGMRMGQLGLLGHCSAADVLAGAEPAFTPDLRSGIPGALYDGDPVASWEDFKAEMVRVLAVLDAPPAS